MLEYIELYVLSIIKGQRKGMFSTLFCFVLFGFSCVFRGIVFLRNAFYDQGWLRCYHPPVPVVISIGNLVAGGTGKTPVTALVAKEFYSYEVALLSRGYRSKLEHAVLPTVICCKDGPLYPASYCGDEPFLLAKELPKSMVIVGKDRKKGADIAAKAGASVLILDDGFQLRSLARDFDVVVMDAKDLFGLNAFLPRGFLREEKKSLRRADLIIFNHVEDDSHFRRVRQTVQFFTKAKMCAVKVEGLAVFDLFEKPLFLKEKTKVALFCAIAKPEYFQITVENLGLEVVAVKTLVDHGESDLRSLEVFAKMAQKKGAEIILCTEKDKVKLSSELDLSLPVGFVKIGLKWVAGENIWSSFIEKIKHELATRI